MKKSLYIISLALLLSCQGENPESNEIEKSTENSEELKSIDLTKEQIDLAEIKTGKIEKQNISESIECSGILEAPPQNIATVSPIINGFVKSLNYYPGEFVQKGAILASLNHPDFITLQQQYIEAKSQYDYYQQEFKRQGELTVENAASIKKMQQAKADFLKYEASYKSLKAQLELLGVNTEEIEKGNYVKDFNLIAPISGTVSVLSTNKGKLVHPDETIYEIINSSVLNINLDVFEKDIPKIKTGQEIYFYLLNSDKLYKNSVKRVGIKIDPTDRTVLVQGIFDNKNFGLNPGSYIRSSVQINKRESYVLPHEAIIGTDTKSYIFVANGNSFKPIRVEQGINHNNYIEIINFDKNLLNADIVIKGAYYLQSAMEQEE